MRFHIAWPLVALPLVAFAPSCSSRTSLGPGEDIAGPQSFVYPDAGVGGAEGGLVSYCPSNKCPSGWTTCPNSRFPCDVNISTDVNNCGGCGIACPQGRNNNEVYSCVDGACVMNCALGAGLDCDGLPENGCETSGSLNNNCGECGRKCLDPEKPCVLQDSLGFVHDCGCPPGRVSCNGGPCMDITNDDYNCGACSVACDPTGGGAPEYPNAKYGCVNGKCGALKCEGTYGDCDGVKSTGCETFLISDANCGACGNACPSGQVCRLTLDQQPTCMCPDGQTFCESFCVGGICVGQCADLEADPHHCGACGATCDRPGLPSPACVYGTCVMTCRQGRADCNNSESDGCEVNTNSDPRNCGECGRACDAIAGQACVAGKCVVEPCDEASGVVAQ